MSRLRRQLECFSAAEEFLDFFQVPYAEAVVNVNRLHILKRFHQYLARGPALEGLDEPTQWQTCKELLARAYGDFVRSTPAAEKVFKVFQDADGQRVDLDSLRASLPSRRQRG
ncbi:MAG: nitrogenase-stabilizing/protective protein NifW [Porticoccaceae bacterium]